MSPTSVRSNLKNNIKFVKFIVSGGANTLLTYAIYWGLLKFISFEASYTISYVMGVVIAYFANRYFVFKTKSSIKQMVFFPSVYIAQYLVGMLAAIVWVDFMKLDARFAPLLGVVLSIPITYILSKIVFTSANRQS